MARVGVVCVAAAFHVGRQVDGIGEELAGSHYLIHRTSDNTHHTTKLFCVEFNCLFVFSKFFYNFKESLKRNDFFQKFSLLTYTVDQATLSFQLNEYNIYTQHTMQRQPMRV